PFNVNDVIHQRKLRAAPTLTGLPDEPGPGGHLRILIMKHLIIFFHPKIWGLGLGWGAQEQTAHPGQSPYLPFSSAAPGIKMGIMRLIGHLDMDAFFAAIEERDSPELKGRPLVVGADPAGGQGRGVVSTANYPARQYGIHSAMPISRAWKLSEAAR